MFESVAVHNESVEKDYFCHYIVSIDVMGNLFPVFLGNNISVRTMNPGKIILPGNKVSEAIGYTLNHWTQLTRFLEDGRLPVDNNLVENSIRPVALGRKNWLFAGSEDGAKRMAIIYSLVATCKLNGINPYEYFYDILPRIPEYPEKNIADLMPTRWKPLKPGGMG